MDQVTLGSIVLYVVPVNCRLWPAIKLMPEGLAETVIADCRFRVTLAVLVESPVSVAVMVTICGGPIPKGAVYNPDEETVPAFGLIDQLTVASVEVYCCVCAS